MKDFTTRRVRNRNAHFTLRAPRPGQPDQAARPSALSAAKATLSLADRGTSHLKTATVPLRVSVTATGSLDGHGRALFNVALSGNRIVANSWLPLREAASALALDRWTNESPVEVTDEATREVIFGGSLGDLGSFCTPDEVRAVERAEMRRAGLPDPWGRTKVRTRRPSNRVTLDSTDWAARQQDQQEVGA
jgi:hypothetical protein